MPWFYNDVSGELANESGIAALPYKTGFEGWKQLPVPGSDTYAQAAAEAVKLYPKSPAPTGSLGAGLGQAGGNAVTSTLGLPQLSNLRDLVTRTVKVIIGALLIIVGVNSLLKNEGISVPKPPAVIPV